MTDEHAAYRRRQEAAMRQQILRHQEDVSYHMHVARLLTGKPEAALHVHAAREYNQKIIRLRALLARYEAQTRRFERVRV